jgi:hypothetical protein
MKRFIPFFVIILTLLISCVPSKQITITSSWMNKERIKERAYKNIYIIGLFNNTTVSTILEYEIAMEANSRRYTTYRNREEFPYIFDNPQQGKEMLLAKVKKMGCDAIFITTLKDVHSETYYVSTSSIGVGVSGYYPYNSYAGNFNSYYSSYYTETSLSGYYQTDKHYFIESNLYDANSLELLWSVQSQSYNPTDIERVSKEYCDQLFKELEKEKDFRGRKEPVAKK